MNALRISPECQREFIFTFDQKTKQRGKFRIHPFSIYDATKYKT